MSRVQLALNVDDLDAAIAFYSKLFATTPAKVRPGYANFAIAEPPLKLVLIEGEARLSLDIARFWGASAIGLTPIDVTRPSDVFRCSRLAE